MKAYESSERYLGKVRECCNYAVRSAKSFVDKGDPTHRQSGGNGEVMLRETLKNDLTTFTDEVIENPFKVDQKAYVMSNMITFILMALAAALAIAAYFIKPMLIIGAFIFSILALLGLFGVFGGTSKNIEDVNIYAKRKQMGGLHHRVILQANLDAPFKRRLSRGTEALLKVLAFIGIIAQAAYDVVLVLIDNGVLNFQFQQTFVYLAFALVPFVFAPLALSLTVSANSSFPGVADNLVGAYAACGAMRYMSEMGLRLNETEFDVLLTSSKATKNKGAKAFCKEFANELSGVDTTVICLDSIYNPDSLSIQVKGRKLSKLFDQAAETAEVMVTDHNPKYHKSEAKVFEKAKINTALITTLPDEVPNFYRSEADDAQNLNVKAVESAIKICLEAAYAIDSEE